MGSNDTALVDNPATDADVGRYLALLPASDFSPTCNGSVGISARRRRYEKAAAHTATPHISHLDAMGRSFLAIANNGALGEYASRIDLDIQGFQRSVIDRSIGRS